jgi:hypothetical protein
MLRNYTFVENYNKANYQGDNQTWNVAQGGSDVRLLTIICVTTA